MSVEKPLAAVSRTVFIVSLIASILISSFLSVVITMLARAIAGGDVSRSSSLFFYLFDYAMTSLIGSQRLVSNMDAVGVFWVVLAILGMIVLLILARTRKPEENTE